MHRIVVTLVLAAVAAPGAAQDPTPIPHPLLHIEPLEMRSLEHVLALEAVSLHAIEKSLVMAEHNLEIGPMRALETSLSTMALRHDVLPLSLYSLDAALATIDAVDAVALPALPPESWAPQDPADSLWRAARAALNAGRNGDAAAMYRRIHAEARFNGSAYRDDAYYWEAYARQRVGGTGELRAALEILAALRQRYPNYENMIDVAGLESRINSQLAASGDAAAAARVAQQAEALTSQQCPDQEIRMIALQAMTHMSEEDALPILREVLARNDACSAELREHALMVLTRHDSPEAADILLDVARNDQNPEVRQHALLWLGHVDDERVVDLIAELVRDPASSRELSEHAVIALSRHDSPRAAQLLREMATRSSTPQEVRKLALMMLVQRDETGENVQFLRELYGSAEDREMKEVILVALSRADEQQASQFMLDIALDRTEPMDVRKQALFFAARQESIPLDRLWQLYQSATDREIREQVVFALSRRDEPAALDRLIEIARSDADPELRKFAVMWIGRSDDPRAVRFIAELIGG